MIAPWVRPCLPGTLWTLGRTGRCRRTPPPLGRGTTPPVGRPYAGMCPASQQGAAECMQRRHSASARLRSPTSRLGSLSVSQKRWLYPTGWLRSVQVAVGKSGPHDAHTRTDRSTAPNNQYPASNTRIPLASMADNTPCLADRRGKRSPSPQKDATFEAALWSYTHTNECSVVGVGQRRHVAAVRPRSVRPP